MASWFRSLPDALDNLVHTARLQQANTHRLMKHYRSKIARYKGIVDKVMVENKCLKE